MTVCRDVAAETAESAPSQPSGSEANPNANGKANDVPTEIVCEKTARWVLFDRNRPNELLLFCDEHRPEVDHESFDQLVMSWHTCGCAECDRDKCGTTKRS